MPYARFSPALFRYLNDLKQNNDRAWFKTNRDRFQRDLRQPALEFITAFGPRLMAISPHFRADPRPSGGSLFRIHRDIRFSKDKSPYKTHAGLHFRHEAGKDAYTPGFYLHLEPRASFVGLGLWHPDNPTLQRLRDAVVADPRSWGRALGGRDFATHFKVMGDRLKRPPRGYDPEHPLIEVLKMKDYVAVAPLTMRQITSPAFLDEFAGLCRTGSPLVRFICRALEQPY